jgi:murein tripeptide amidase MpaA
MSFISISSAFDGGNIVVVDASSAAKVSLKIRPDPHTQLENKQFMQWFAFRSIAPPAVVNYEILNAGQSSFPKAWAGSSICVTTDRKTYKRIPSTYVNGVLGFTYDHSDAAAQVTNVGLYSSRIRSAKPRR